MTVIALPTGFYFSDVEWSLDVPAQRNRSPWTSHSKVVGLPGAETWHAKLTVETIATENDERLWRAFLMKMRGIINAVDIPVLDCQRPYGGATARVRNGSNNGNGYTNELDTTVGSQTILRAGEFMTFALPSGHKRMVCLTADLVTDSVGYGLVTFEPALDETPAVLSAVELANPFARMNLKERRQGWRTTDGLTQIELDAEEAL